MLDLSSFDSCCRSIRWSGGTAWLTLNQKSTPRKFSLRTLRWWHDYGLKLSSHRHQIWHNSWLMAWRCSWVTLMEKRDPWLRKWCTISGRKRWDFPHRRNKRNKTCWKSGYCCHYWFSSLQHHSLAFIHAIDAYILPMCKNSSLSTWNARSMSACFSFACCVFMNIIDLFLWSFPTPQGHKISSLME